jgi:uncharacterized protein YrrD
MPVKVTEIEGKPVIAKDNGKEIKKVEKVVFNPETKMVAGITVGKEQGPDTEVVTAADISEAGKDAVLVESEQAVKKASEAGPEMVGFISSKSFLPKQKIMTEKGKQLGKLKDISFEPKTGILDELMIDQGLLSGTKPIKATNLISIGKDAILVKEAAGQEIEQQPGGVKAMLSKAKETVIKPTPAPTPQPTTKVNQNLTSDPTPEIETRQEKNQGKEPNQSKIKGSFDPNSSPEGSAKIG